MLKTVQSNWIQPFPQGRINAEQTAKCVGCNDHDIPAVVAAGLLHPLGHPSQSSIKYFATEVVQRLCADPNWLGKVTDAIYKRWRLKNKARSRKNKHGSQSKKHGSASPNDTPYDVHTDLPEA